MNAGSPNVHGTEDLLGVTLASRGHLRLAAAPRPRLIERGILPKTGLIGEQQRRTEISGFFLASDRCSAASDPGDLATTVFSVIE